MVEVTFAQLQRVASGFYGRLRASLLSWLPPFMGSLQCSQSSQSRPCCSYFHCDCADSAGHAGYRCHVLGWGRDYDRTDPHRLGDGACHAYHFAVVQAAGDFIGLQMGLAFASFLIHRAAPILWCYRAFSI